MVLVTDCDLHCGSEVVALGMRVSFLSFFPDRREKWFGSVRLFWFWVLVPGLTGCVLRADACVCQR